MVETEALAGVREKLQGLTPTRPIRLPENSVNHNDARSGPSVISTGLEPGDWYSVTAPAVVMRPILFLL